MPISTHAREKERSATLISADFPHAPSGPDRTVQSGIRRRSESIAPVGLDTPQATPVAERAIGYAAPMMSLGLAFIGG
ncbi:MAG TPA: hypothetical protein VNO21_21650, partial [Polyangiaceae bacterium]|nr:hypothetical protein [Polyangiaceae bacterium]